MIDRKQIIEAWAFLRHMNNDIPDEVLDFIKESSLAALEPPIPHKDVAYTCFNGNKYVLYDKYEQLQAENKKLLGLLEREVKNKVFFNAGGLMNPKSHTVADNAWQQFCKENNINN